ncbi:hypothetical protein KP509_06G016800 [Ceratopteris richardii]|nr:hypothetical protein KP509_06G016800 [Ceratopteris richardii]
MACNDHQSVPPFPKSKRGKKNADGHLRIDKGKRNVSRKGLSSVKSSVKYSPGKAAKESEIQNMSNGKSLIKTVAGAFGKDVKERTQSKDLNNSPSTLNKKRKRRVNGGVEIASDKPLCDTTKGSILSSKDDSSRRKLDPFFWLREESSQEAEAIQSTQLTLTQSMTKPCFSDLVDSDDDDGQCMNANEGFSNCVTIHEAGTRSDDDFDWIQVPSSPEINCSQPKDKAYPMRGTNINASKALVVAQDGLDPELVGRKEISSKLESGATGSGSNPTVKPKNLQKRRAKQTHMPDVSKDYQCISKNMLGEEKTHSNFQEACTNSHTRTMKKYHKGEPNTSQTDAECEQKGIINEEYKRSDAASSSLPICIFCRSSSCTKVTGSMRHYDHEGNPFKVIGSEGKLVHAHIRCAEWAPDVYFIEDQARNLYAEAMRGLKIKCTSCGKKGAALGCCIKRCRRSYHYPCARALSCRWDEEHFIMLCPEHHAEEFPSKQRSERPRKATRSPKEDSKMKELGHVSGHTETLTRWACLQSSKWVLCGSGLDSDGKDQLATFAKVSDATVLNSWSSNVTHLIAGVDEHGAAKRTMKYLMAILNGKWILKPEWLNACIEAGNHVCEEPFEINVDIHGTIQGPKQGRMCAMHKASKLFSKVQFYFMPDFPPSYKGDIQALVMAGGAAVLHRKPVPSATDMGKSTVIVYHNQNVSGVQELGDGNAFKLQQARTLARSVGATVVSQQWILDSIASFQLLPRK